MKLGRGAERPKEIPKRGWMEILKRVWGELKKDRVNFVAAGIAFYMMLAMVPALGALMSIYGLVADPADVERQLAEANEVVPADVIELVGGEMKRLAENDEAAGWGLVVGLALSLWGASKAMDALITSMNVAYEEVDTRNFVKRKLLGLGLTLGGVFFVIFVMGLLVVTPTVLAYAQVGWLVEILVTVARWVLMFGAVMVWLSVIYRFAPNRRNAKWCWVTWGSFVATFIWLIASAGLTWYAASFGNYSATYGSLGAIVLLLLWFYVTGYSIMLGAELNSEMELQTRVDSTVGRDLPMGDRGAYVADHLGSDGERSGGE